MLLPIYLSLISRQSSTGQDTFQDWLIRTKTITYCLTLFHDIIIECIINCWEIDFILLWLVKMLTTFLVVVINIFFLFSVFYTGFTRGAL